MDQKLELIEHLLSLFDERDQARQAITRKIMYTLGPTVLVAIMELLEVSPDDLMWDDFRIVDTVLLTAFTVSYNPSTTESEMLRKLSPPPRDDGAPVVEVQQLIHLSLPLTLAFQDKEEIKAFFLKTFVEAEPTLATEPAEPPPANIALTKEQVRQMLFFQQQTKGTKQ